jgi:F-type H+-transporting ATPase subunit b
MHIDWWTLALQTVNVLVLIWILGRFFFQPVASLVARRRAEAARLIADADAARKEGENLRAEAARARADIDAARDRLIVEARKAAEAEKASVLAESSRALDEQRRTAEIAIANEHAAMQRKVLDQATELSVDIARRLLERLPAAAAFSAFLDGLAAELAKLPAETRRSLAASNADHPLEVSAAATPSEAEAERLRDTIGAALGGALPIKLSCNPNLIAGFEIQSRDVVVRNNWQSDLATIQRELGS